MGRPVKGEQPGSSRTWQPETDTDSTSISNEDRAHLLYALYSYFFYRLVYSSFYRVA